MNRAARITAALTAGDHRELFRLVRSELRYRRRAVFGYFGGCYGPGFRPIAFGRTLEALFRGRRAHECRRLVRLAHDAQRTLPDPVRPARRPG